MVDSCAQRKTATSVPYPVLAEFGGKVPESYAWSVGCPFSAVTGSGRVWRKVPESYAWSVGCPFSAVTSSGRVWRKVPESYTGSVHAYLDGGAVDPGDNDEGLGAAEGGVLVVVGAGAHALVRVGHHLVQQEPRDVQQHHQHDDHADLHLNTAKLAD